MHKNSLTTALWLTHCFPFMQLFLIPLFLTPHVMNNSDVKADYQLKQHHLNLGLKLLFLFSYPWSPTVYLLHKEANLQFHYDLHRLKLHTISKPLSAWFHQGTKFWIRHNQKTIHKLGRTPLEDETQKLRERMRCKLR